MKVNHALEFHRLLDGKIDDGSTVQASEISRIDYETASFRTLAVTRRMTCCWLKTSVETLDIPIIVVTGFSTKEAEREAAAQAGCFIAKGPDVEGVVRVIREVVARPRSAERF